MDTIDPYARYVNRCSGYPVVRHHVSMREATLSDTAEALRWLRERIGLSREQLADASGVSAVYIKFIERGKRNPSEAVIARLLPALRVTRADLDGLLTLQPWASSTAAGTPATLSAYAAGVPLAVVEGSAFGTEPVPSAPAASALAPLAAPAAAAPGATPQGFATAPPPPPPSAAEPSTLDAELIELRERYVHLPRSKQEMVLGWLRALDDR